MPEHEIVERPLVLCARSGDEACVFNDCPIYELCEVGKMVEKQELNREKNE